MRSQINKLISLKKGSLSAVILALIISILFITQLSFPVLAFSDYEENVADRLYSDLEKEYRITEFNPGSLEYETLKNLEANIVNPDFKNAEFKVHHIDDKLINAYYIGNGNIMLFEGLLQELDTEDQLAGLIAHEMGHAVEEHLTEDLERNLGLSILNILFNHFTDNQYQTMTNIAQNLIANGYSREQEQESDIYAVDLMMRTGYNPEGLIELMKIFKESSHNVKLLEFTQTHPIPDSRIEYLEDYIAQKRSEGNNDGQQDQAGLKIPEKKEKEQETSRTEFTLNEEFKQEQVSFSYPDNWSLDQQRAFKKEIKFKYQIKADKINGEITFEDLSSKEFMQTAEKQFRFAAINAEENGFIVNESQSQENDLNIYKLELEKNNQFKLSYFVAQNNRQQLLRFDFDLNKNDQQQRRLIEEVVKSIQF